MDRNSRGHSPSQRIAQALGDETQQDVTLEFDLDDLRRLHRLLCLGAWADPIDPDNDRVLAFVGYQLSLAEKAAHEAYEAKHGPAGGVYARYIK